MTDKIENEIRQRMQTLVSMGMDLDVETYRKEKPLCCFMFRFGNVYSNVLTEMDQNEQIQKVKAEFEKNYEAIAYYGIYSEEEKGAELALFYISMADAAEWEQERGMLQAGTPLAYIYNFTEKYDDIMPAAIEVRDGIVIRKRENKI